MWLNDCKMCLNGCNMWLNAIVPNEFPMPGDCNMIMVQCSYSSTTKISEEILLEYAIN